MHLRCVSFIACFALITALGACDRLRGCGNDTGTGVTQAAATQRSPGAACDACRARMCANPDAKPDGIDLVAGCYVKPDPRHVPDPDADFAADCRAAMECAYASDCAYDATLGPARCYCGSRQVDECLSQGPAPDAPCVGQWQKATRGKSNAEILERMSLIEYPSGWAFNLLECDRDRCGPKSELGRCTP
jgi:hypothetical protein